MNRPLDAVAALLGIAVTSPLLAASALAIKLDDGGPVFYRQTRVGKDGKDFELLKLRTMEVGAETKGAGFAVDAGDSRITRVGRLLRRTSVDELPQLWNVARGEMSLIGPRPTLRYQVETYTARQRRRLDVRPGLTGWAQVNGRATLPWEQRIELDVWYVEHRSPRVDLTILMRTPGALFGGTYKGATGGWNKAATPQRSLIRPARMDRSPLTDGLGPAGRGGRRWAPGDVDPLVSTFDAIGERVVLPHGLGEPRAEVENCEPADVGQRPCEHDPIERPVLHTLVDEGERGRSPRLQAVKDEGVQHDGMLAREEWDGGILKELAPVQRG